MKKLMRKCRDLWNNLQNTGNADKNLQAALKRGDADAAVEAVSFALPARELCEDRLLRVVARYAQSENCDKKLLDTVRAAVYKRFDEKLIRRFDLFDMDNKPEAAAGYQNPDYVYAMAAYMDDAQTLRQLARYDITPDEVSSSALTENIVMGTARRGCFEAMKEVIRQGASLDKVFGFDDFPPMHAFSKPLFHAFHPGVTEALVGTGKTEILHTVAKVVGEDKLMEIEKRCGRRPPSTGFYLPQGA
ncbi:MAG: hypothetical protein EP349_03360 [Alphaproteobacteria bacterium]|nr:MAG: hypothetical protein EP349_03360 [Alphaproteobacteria bacterium]